jgi:hypothetical protein
MMIKASALADLLQLTLGDGVDSAMLLSSTGTLLSAVSAQQGPGFAETQTCRMFVALVANMWRSYSSTLGGMPVEPGTVADSSMSGSSTGNNSENGGVGASTDLEVVVLEPEQGKLCCVSVGKRHVLILYATSSSAVEIGMMKVKAGRVMGDLLGAMCLSSFSSSSANNSPSR